MEERLLAILRLALLHNANDIHITKENDEMTIEVRIEGKLRKIKTFSSDKKIIRYLQYLSNMNVGILNVPQTKKFEVDVDGKKLNLRFAALETSNKENGVLRIL